MRIDVLFGPSQLTSATVSGRVVAVVDVLRASTSIAIALANGARNIVPLESTEEVITRAKALDRSEVRLAGERKNLPIPGFDFGNSPRHFTREAVEGKTLLMTTTNGTAALAAIQGARDVVVASYVNFTAVCTLLRAALRGGADVTLLCAEQERQFSLEDAACAGRYVQHLTGQIAGIELNDAARAGVLIDARYGERLDQLFAESDHGRALIDAGFAEDLATCASIDSVAVIPLYQDRQITKLGPERER